MNFGIVGTGMIAHFHAAAINAIAGAKLIAVHGRNLSTMNDFASKYACTPYQELDDMLQNPSIDIVTIATPSGAHLEPVLAAAERGKHILCEKPLEISIDRIEQMIAHCEKYQVVLSGIFNRRFNPAVGKVKEAIQSNAFGKIALAQANIPWYRDQAYYDSAAWRGTLALDGGGVLMNQSIHTIDLLLYFMGPVKRVSASSSLIAHEGIEVEDTAVALLEFENGALGSINASTACWSSKGIPAEISILGSKGNVCIQDDKFKRWEFQNEDLLDEVVQAHMVNDEIQGLGANDPKAINAKGHQLNFENLVRSIKEDKVPLINGDEAKKSVSLINHIYKSASQNGAWVNISK